MDGALLLLGATGLVSGLGALEAIVHRRRIARIPIRIHVNGTRGKSGVTRLIAAGLRAGGVRTFAKTTGTLPQMILPDGSERPVFRPRGANVIEQVKILGEAVKHRPQALVLECMAVQPQLQSLCELDIVRSTHGVITNARPDHLDVMGPTARDVALALAGSTPIGGKLYTAEQDLLDVFRAAAADRKSALCSVDRAAFDQVTAAEMADFSYIEHRENVALALAVCCDLGIARSVALAGMYAATPDAGVMTTHRLDMCRWPAAFVNGFAANDPESTEHNWRLAISYFPELKQRIAVFNCRDDRTDRSQQMAHACADWPRADRYLLIGTGTQVFARSAAAAGIPRDRIESLEGASSEGILRRIAKRATEPCLVMGMANIGGPGLKLLGVLRAAEQAAAAPPVRPGDFSDVARAA
jgi:poly-gamma-glutamate synthase PgsB/CapB